MSTEEFLIILICCGATMLACRVLPLFLLKGRELSSGITRALNLIPPAAFAALVANDILTPGMFSEGLWPAGSVIVASLVVILIAIKTKSLLWSAIGGVASYALLMAL